MKYTKQFKVEICNLVRERSKTQNIDQSLREISGEAQMSYKTLKNWYYPNSYNRYCITRSKYVTYKSTDERCNYPDPVDYSFEEFLYRIAAEKCLYCAGIENLGLDRIDNNKGHSKANTVVACKRCNILRNDRFTIEEFKLIGKALQHIDNDQRMMKNR